MKKINKIGLLMLMVAGLIFLTGCDKAKLLKVEQTLDGGSVEFLLAPQSSLNYDVSQSETMDISESIKQYNLSLDQVKSLKLESAVVEILDSTGKITNFDITDNMSVELGTSTIPQMLVASKDPVPHTALTTLDLDVAPDVDMIPFAKANDINYHMKLKLNKVLDHLVRMKMSVKWKVKGEI